MYTLRLFDSSVNEVEMLELITSHKTSLDRLIGTLNKYHEKLNGIVVDSESFYDHMSELSSTTGSYLLAVVLYKEIPVAFCTALYENGELLIERLFVDEDHRLGEIGKTLYEALVALSEPTYIKTFCVNGNNKGAAFFESIGFVMSPTESSRRCKVFEKKPQQEDFILNEIPREQSQRQESNRLN